MNMPQVSVVIPVYKVERYLRCCLDSLQAQVFSDFEVLLIDDGSPDTSGAICDEYAVKDSRFRVWHLENGGPSRARNFGLSQANGEWVLFVDSDDWIHRNLLSLPNECPGSDLIFFAFKHVREDREETCEIGFESSLITDHTAIDHCLYRLFVDPNVWFGYTCNKFFRRSIIAENNIKFREDLYFKEDEVFSLLYCQHIHSLSVIDKPYYNYRILTGSLSHGIQRYCNYKALIDTLVPFVQSTPYKTLQCAFEQRVISYYVSSLLELVVHKYPRSEFFEIITTADAYYHQHKSNVAYPFPKNLFFKIKSAHLRYWTMLMAYQLKRIFRRKQKEKI